MLKLSEYMIYCKSPISIDLLYLLLFLILIFNDQALDKLLIVLLHKQLLIFLKHVFKLSPYIFFNIRYIFLFCIHV